MDIETWDVTAIGLHRQFVQKSNRLFPSLPDGFKLGTARGVQNLEYIEAIIEMHAQMSPLNTLVGLLGFTPKVSVN